MARWQIPQYIHAGEIPHAGGELAFVARGQIPLNPRDIVRLINHLNEVFVTDQLTDKDMVNYAYTIRDKVGENLLVMKQIENNSAEQALLGDFSKAIDDAILDSSDAHQNQMMQLLADPSKAANFARIVFDLLVQGQAGNR